MTQRNEALLWWKIALHLDEAQLSLVNVMAMNVDDPRAIYALQEKVREAQAILLDIFGAKGLLPRAAPKPTAPVGPPMPPSMVMPPPMGPPPGAPPGEPPMTPEQFSESLAKMSGSWMAPPAEEPEAPAIVVQETTEEAPSPPPMQNGSTAPIEAVAPVDPFSTPSEPEA